MYVFMEEAEAGPLSSCGLAISRFSPQANTVGNRVDTYVQPYPDDYDGKHPTTCRAYYSVVFADNTTSVRARGSHCPCISRLEGMMRPSVPSSGRGHTTQRTFSNTGLGADALEGTCVVHTKPLNRSGGHGYVWLLATVLG